MLGGGSVLNANKTNGRPFYWAKIAKEKLKTTHFGNWDYIERQKGLFRVPLVP